MPNSSLSADEIRRRARWYVNVRWLYLLGIGVPSIATLIFAYGFGPQVRQDVWLLSNVLIINALFMLSAYIRITSVLIGRILAAAQIVFDLLLMSMAFLINGGGETPLAMFFAIPIVMTAAFFGRRAIYAVGCTVAALYTTLMLLDYAKLVHPLNVAAPQLHSDPKLVFPALVAVVTIFLAITVITDLVGRLIREREDLVQQMQVLSAHSAEMDAVLKTMGSALVTVGPRGNITHINDSFERLTGWHHKDAIGRPLDDVLPILDAHGKRIAAARRPMLQFLAAGKNATEHLGKHGLQGYSYVRKDGSTFPFVGSVAPIQNGKRIIGFTTVFDDATETHKIEQLKDNFIALVSHQLKTPIGEINGFAYNLLSGIGGSLSEKQAEYVTLIQEQAARSGKLIADLLDIVLAGAGGLTVNTAPVALDSIIQEVIKQQQTRIERSGLQLKTHLPKETLFVQADARKAVQAIDNLVNNAIAYSKQGAITLSIVPAEQEVEIFVADEGHGMDRATMETLFGDHDEDGPLARAPTAEGGTGLGVYLAKQLIGLMHGTIKVVSTSKHGTIICVTLPRVKP